MNSKKVRMLAASAAVIALCGCATSAKRPVYTSSQVGRVITEQKGEIIGVQDVTIEAPSMRAGSPGAGSQIGSAVAVAAITGSTVGAAVAAGRVIGGMAGAKADNKNGEELTILMKDGRTVIVVQERGEVPFTVGEKVRVLSGASTSVFGGAGGTQILHDEVYAKSF